MKAKSKSYYRNKADKLIQELGRHAYTLCEVCGKQASCLHHYFPKSMAGGLRYDWENLIPLCQGCHFRHHNGAPEIHATVLKQRGQSWHDDLVIKKRNYVQSDTISYYKSIIEKLSKLL